MATETPIKQKKDNRALLLYTDPRTGEQFSIKLADVTNIRPASFWSNGQGHWTPNPKCQALIFQKDSMYPTEAVEDVVTLTKRACRDDVMVSVDDVIAAMNTGDKVQDAIDAIFTLITKAQAAS